jgi:hypothetical protein
MANAHFSIGTLLTIGGGAASAAGTNAQFVSRALLRGEAQRQPARDERDRAALNTDALRTIWDNDVDAIYDAMDWRTGKREKAKVSAR